MKRAHASKSEFSCLAFNLYARCTYCPSESKFMKESENISRHFLSKY